MSYLEPLPDGCPIDKAKDESIGTAWRVTSNNPPDISDFYSNAYLGVPCTEIQDPCRHASCSLFKQRAKALNIAQKLPKVRVPAPHLSLCEIQAGQGKTYINKKKHVDFWPYETFKPENIVISTVEIDSADQAND